MQIKLKMLQLLCLVQTKLLLLPNLIIQVSASLCFYLGIYGGSIYRLQLFFVQGIERIFQTSIYIWLLTTFYIYDINQLTKLVEVYVALFSDRSSILLSSTIGKSARTFISIENKQTINSKLGLIFFLFRKKSFKERID